MALRCNAGGNVVMMHNLECQPEEVLNGLKSYWGERSTSYSRQNIEELNNWKRDVWRDLILQNAPEKECLRILDVGTGPGFFAINLSLAGHQVTGVDVTEEMLSHARENAGAYGAQAEFLQYDGKHLPFGNDSFDLVISRNVLWNMEEPYEALLEWKRVLKKGGRIVYFDANWYLYLFDEEQRVRHETAHARYHELYPGMPHDQLGEDRVRFLEELAKSLPLSREHRPKWDMEAADRAGFSLVKMIPNVGELVWNEAEKIHYEATPLFMICAEKR